MPVLQHRWVPDDKNWVAIRCPHCGGETEALKRVPERPYPNAYINRILLCMREGCRRFMPTG